LAVGAETRIACGVGEREGEGSVVESSSLSPSLPLLPRRSRVLVHGYGTLHDYPRRAVPRWSSLRRGVARPTSTALGGPSTSFPSPSPCLGIFKTRICLFHFHQPTPDLTSSLPPSHISLHLLQLRPCPPTVPQPPLLAVWTSRRARTSAIPSCSPGVISHTASRVGWPRLSRVWTDP
jgi:hypothetical protein